MQVNFRSGKDRYVMVPFEKLRNFQSQLKRDGVEAALVTSSTNLFYLTDLFANAVLLFTPDQNWYFTDFRTMEVARQHFEGSGIHVEMAEGSFIP